MRFFQVTLFVWITAVYCLAVPANDRTFPLKQPDGSMLEARFVGDERFHVLQTEDGYFLKKDILGFYSYVNEKGDPSGIYARNANERGASEIEFLKGLNQKFLFRHQVEALSIFQGLLWLCLLYYRDRLYQFHHTLQ